MDSSLAASIKPQVLTRTISASSGSAHHFVIVLVQQPGHDFGIDQIAGASEADDVEFLFGLAHCPSSTTSAPFGNLHVK